MKVFCHFHFSKSRERLDSEGVTLSDARSGQLHIHKIANTQIQLFLYFW